MCSMQSRIKLSPGLNRPRLVVVSRRHGLSMSSSPVNRGLHALPSSDLAVPGGRPASMAQASYERQAFSLDQLLPGGMIAPAAAALVAGSLLLGLPADAAVPAADTAAALSIPGIIGDSPLREGVVSGFLLIFFSELGDKTFFIALLLALKQPKGLVFAGTFGALAVMTVISVLLGQVLHQVDELVPAGAGGLPYDDLLACALLLYFGIKTIKDAKDADESAAEEKEEAKEVVDGVASGQDALKLVLTTFTLVFAAEWGDKSFLATIALAAASSPLGVTAGAVAGHGVATGLAVAGGGLLSRYFSESFLQYVGGSLFLVFAAATVVDIF
ncbi:GDT1-like protein 1, chloroplastic, partial [Tetrabaena socialis]